MILTYIHTYIYAIRVTSKVHIIIYFLNITQSNIEKRIIATITRYPIEAKFHSHSPKRYLVSLRMGNLSRNDVRQKQHIPHNYQCKFGIFKIVFTKDSAI